MNIVVACLLAAVIVLDIINSRLRRRLYVAMNGRMDAHGEHLVVHDRRFDLAQRHLDSLTRRLDAQNARLSLLETDGK